MRKENKKLHYLQITKNKIGYNLIYSAIFNVYREVHKAYFISAFG